MGQGRSEPRGNAGFSPVLRCLIQQWRALELWIEEPESRTRQSAFDTFPLREILTRRVSPIDKRVRPLDHLNVIAKVTFSGELFLRGENEKRGYKGLLFEALPGDLIISKIRVGQGSFCVIGKDLDHVAVSPEYPVYTPNDERVDVGYLVLTLRSPQFLAELTGSVSGNTTKRRIRPEFFQDIQVPLPSLQKQRALAAAHRAALERAAALENEADETEAQAMAEFEAALGFEPPALLPDRPVFVAAFKDLDRWSHEAILRRTIEGDTRRSPYPIVQLGNVIADLKNGWSPKCHNRPAEDDVWGVLKVSAASSGEYREIENKALPRKLEAREGLEVQAGVARGAAGRTGDGPDPEVAEKATRRRFSGEYKRRIVSEADRCRNVGEVGALLRREGLYSSSLSTWRRQGAAGALAGTGSVKRGPKAPPKDVRDTRIAELERETRRLQRKLTQAETIIGIQKKLPRCWGSLCRAWTTTSTTDGSGRDILSGCGNRRVMPSIRSRSFVAVSPPAAPANGGTDTACIASGLERRRAPGST